MTTSDIISILSVLATVILGVFVIIQNHKFDKRLKAYEIWMEDFHEINNKMHDRLVDVEEAIKVNKCPPDNVYKRLLYNSSRLIKHDETIYDDVQLLINKCAEMFSIINKDKTNSDDLLKLKSDIINLIKTIKHKVDDVQKNLTK